MRRSVREQLEDFELIAGQWRKKASDTSGAASDRWEAFTNSLQDQFSATKEQIQDWLTELGKSSEQVRELFNRVGLEEDSEELHREGFSREAFSTWLSRGRKDKDGANEEDGSGCSKTKGHNASDTSRDTRTETTAVVTNVDSSETNDDGATR